MNDIVDIGKAFPEKPLEQLYAHRDAHPDQNGLPTFEFSKGQALDKTDGNKHHRIHDDFMKQ